MEFQGPSTATSATLAAAGRACGTWKNTTAGSPACWLWEFPKPVAILTWKAQFGREIVNACRSVCWLRSRLPCGSAPASFVLIYQ